ncbi:MAG: hypothetical protein M3126_10015 [Candidatus Eremiobacteraeota bacterium]|nr:hypothetical protein [Candidatus Eremiobacteraeota bacterium]
MKRLRLVALAGIALLVAACQGSFSSGPQIPQLPGTATGPSTTAPQSAASGTEQKPLTAQPQTFALTDAPSGFKCPDAGGYSCVIRFNIPPETPTPVPTRANSKNKKRTITPSPSPSPTPSPTPVPSPSAVASTSPGASPHGSASPNASATPAGGTISISLVALPADVPKMVITDQKNAVPTIPLMRLTLVLSNSYILDGPASIVFTLPKDQLVENRSFAIQLFEETVHKKKTDHKPLFTLTKSTLEKEQLTFAFRPPKIELPKDHHYLVVLYADQLPATPLPAASASASPTSASPVAIPSFNASVRPSATP